MSYLNPNKSVEDWFFTAILEQYESLEAEEKVVWMRRFQFRPDESKPDLWIWLDEDESAWFDETMKLCHEITDNMDIFGESMPDCFKTAFFNQVEEEIQEWLDYWIEEVKSYAQSHQEEDIMDRTEWEAQSSLCEKKKL
jgi:hypothetical protein